MKKNILITFFYLMVITVSAQNYVDILKVSANTTPFNKFDTSTATTQLNELVTDLTVPVKVNEKLTALSGVIYEAIQTKLFAEGNVKNFGSIALKLGLSNKFSDKWTGTMVLLPKISSDYSSIGSNDFQMGGVAIMKYQKRENLSYKMGLYYNSELFGPFFVPMLGVYYLSPNQKFETNIMLPLQADVNYKVIPFMQVGCNFNGQLRSYHLTDVTPGHQSTYVARSTNELFAYLKFNFSKNLSIQTRVGQSVGRSYKVFDEGDKVTFGLPATYIGGNRQQLNSKFSNGLVFQVTVLYRINIVKK